MFAGEGVVFAVVLSKVLYRYTGGSAPKSNPFPIHIPFLREKIPLSFNNPSIGNF